MWTIILIHLAIQLFCGHRSIQSSLFASQGHIALKNLVTLNYVILFKKQVSVPLISHHHAIHKHPQSLIELKSLQNNARNTVRFSPLDVCVSYLLVLELHIGFFLSLDECCAPVGTQRHTFLLNLLFSHRKRSDFLQVFLTHASRFTCIGITLITCPINKDSSLCQATTSKPLSQEQDIMVNIIFD